MIDAASTRTVTSPDAGAQTSCHSGESSNVPSAEIVDLTSTPQWSAIAATCLFRRSEKTRQQQIHGCNRDFMGRHLCLRSFIDDEGREAMEHRANRQLSAFHCRFIVLRDCEEAVGCPRPQL